jgi:hypothetical protein
MKNDTLYDRALKAGRISKDEFGFLAPYEQESYLDKGHYVLEGADSLLKEGDNRIDVVQGCTVETMVGMSRVQRQEFIRKGYRLF